MDGKKVSESTVKMTELVLPNDTNLLGNLLGGRLMHWMDIAGALTATRHGRRCVATVQVESLDFKHPIRQGEMVEVLAEMVYVGNTSMVTRVTAEAENLQTGAKRVTNEAYFTYVALDDEERPTKVPPLILETQAQKEAYQAAQIRKDNKNI